MLNILKIIGLAISLVVVASCGGAETSSSGGRTSSSGGATYTTQNNTVITIAGIAGITGSADGTGTAARFNLPYGIATDGTNLYVADYGNSTIRKIVISTGVVTTIAGTAGTTGSADGTGAAATFYSPVGIATDGTNLYVADRGNNNIRKILISSGVVMTIAGDPTGASGSADGTGAAATFNSPAGIATDGTNLYVADTYNSTIRKIY
jgi:hypothetical protein